MEATRKDKTVQVEVKEREKEILAVAAQLSAHEGFETVAVRNIASAVSLSKATLYHCFYLLRGKYLERHSFIVGSGWSQPAAPARKSGLLARPPDQNLRKVIREGIEAGEFRAVNRAVAGRAILSILNRMGCWYKPDGPTRTREFVLEYADLFLGGLNV